MTTPLTPPTDNLAAEGGPRSEMSEQDAAWWLSWYHDAADGEFEYHGPWWVSGYDMDDRMIVVAAVPAPTEDAAWDIVQTAYDTPPEDINRRFCDALVGDPWGSPESRFPRQDWMRWPDVTRPVSTDVEATR